MRDLMDIQLNKTIDAFNRRRFAEASGEAAEGLAVAQGRDEVFWMGVLEICEGFALISGNNLLKAEKKLVGAMEKLRNFGFTYRNFEVTRALAGTRRCVEEIRLTRQVRSRVFDVSLIPQLRLAAQADNHIG